MSKKLNIKALGIDVESIQKGNLTKADFVSAQKGLESSVKRKEGGNEVLAKKLETWKAGLSWEDIYDQVKGVKKVADKK